MWVTCFKLFYIKDNSVETRLTLLNNKIMESPFSYHNQMSGIIYAYYYEYYYLKWKKKKKTILVPNVI
jgi:hypothetical protein